jgi:hypothetical protein
MIAADAFSTLQATLAADVRGDTDSTFGGGLQAAAGFKGPGDIYSRGGARGAGVSGLLRALPLSDFDEGTERAGIAGADQGEGDALGRAAYRRADPLDHPAWAWHDAVGAGE